MNNTAPEFDDSIEIVIEDREEAQVLLDCLNAAIDNGNKNEVILDLAYKLDAGLCQWKGNVDFHELGVE